MQNNFYGAGLGLRRDFLDDFISQVPDSINFMEVAPENWMTLGGRYHANFSRLAQQHKFVCHGLSLSIGSPDELDEKFVQQVKSFLDEYQILYYSEHLSFCSANGHMYDLMPIPFTNQAVDYVVARIQRVQDILQRPLVLENVSYYTPLSQEISEIEFTQSILKKSGALMLLDVNNVYVNSINHNYDAKNFIAAMPSEKIVYGHIAGHYNEADDLIVDTHGADVIEPVWQLLDYAYKTHGVFPTLLERDFNIPSVADLIKEMNRIHTIQAQHLEK
ncbi:DUF692 domain-containing protein [Catenovulum maritimum]|uniref:Uncharacterized protein n=1 Tax=Catenovulum maritimum TaxID=1513271 RepID=A0A0J8GT07_9ALTE|nr:DUF692 domain-containing protein [Catenovulum maritimum]KMT65892.1 hypothetical protein XM47_06775 [Catenovulum maritimum]